MKLCIIGTGHVGLVTGACFAEIGNQVICVDNDEEKIKMIKKGKMPIYEPELEELVKRNSSEGRLSFSTSIAEGTVRSRVIFIAVGTPPKENGEADLSSVEKVCREIARNAKEYRLIVEKSTVPVQTGQWIKHIFQLSNNQVDFDIASNPEFLREGSAVRDFLNPDRIVIGVERERAAEILKQLYQPIIKREFDSRLRISVSGSDPVPLVVTDIQSSEIIKHASNSFLATKISFINAVADLCERAGADVEKVAEGMGYDPRIGSSFLKAGVGFGGFCFPKDLQAFIHIAEKLNYDFTLLKEVQRINRERPHQLVRKLEEALWILKDKTIGILGLSFKPDTDDMRFAPSIQVINLLQKEGSKIKAYDPVAMPNAKLFLNNIEYMRDPYEAASGSDALVIITEWEEFRNLDLRKIKRLLETPVIVDGRNIYDPREMHKLGFIYKSIGKG
ncbi:UDP-glucose/GDP-mannose dehydrogenase family protein [Candidatus Aerophobetes bacterium]|uniref:UDP-glucose 6-dehydrogenase n=1 Tax=Aerophobetes bacterium TaxID=2030807 RepID=A0A523UL48_UNCAE|nr:MAG: UDP-glucose/GDP-mannose dehydrogenase family protein [Candidatus Aerophobetes bacterium]